MAVDGNVQPRSARLIGRRPLPLCHAKMSARMREHKNIVMSPVDKRLFMSNDRRTRGYDYPSGNCLENSVFRGFFEKSDLSPVN
jgi:hypothetical protein